MPRELIAIGPRQPVIREYTDPPLSDHDVRIHAEFSAPKHGTEMGNYRANSPFANSNYDPTLKMFVPRDAPGQAFPIALGNMTVGRVVEVGAMVSKWRIGDRVYGHLPIRETHTAHEDRVHALPPGMKPEAVVYVDPAEFALGAVRDANIRLGERVAVFGLGAIGLMAAQMARLSGATHIIAVDPIPLRRELSLRHGADQALDPRAGDVSIEIKRLMDQVGPDVVIEASGSYKALHECIRCVHYAGLVVPLAYYQGESAGLRLGEEWHMNRITMRSSRSISDPNRDHPMWDSGRIRDMAFDLLRTGRLSVEGLITPVVPFDQSAEAYRAIDEKPETSIKLGVVYP